MQAVEGTLRVNGRAVARNTRLMTARDLAAFGGGTYLRYTSTGGAGLIVARGTAGGGVAFVNHQAGTR